MYVGYSFNIGLVYITILVMESYMLVAVRKWSGLRYRDNIGNDDTSLILMFCALVRVG